MGIERVPRTLDEIIIGHVAAMRSYADSLKDGWPLVSRAKVEGRIRKCASEVERARNLICLQEARRAASVDNLPQGRDAQQGSVGTKGSAMPQADAQSLDGDHP